MCACAGNITLQVLCETPQRVQLLARGTRDAMQHECLRLAKDELARECAGGACIVEDTEHVGIGGRSLAWRACCSGGDATRGDERKPPFMCLVPGCFAVRRFFPRCRADVLAHH